MWTSIWRWMHGGSTSPPAAALTASTPRVLLLEAGGVHGELTEVERTGEAYMLGNAAANGDRHALAALFHVLQEPASVVCRRAAGYGLGAAGARAVQGLAALLQQLALSAGEGSIGLLGTAEGRSLGAACVHALGEACAACPLGSRHLAKGAVASLRTVLGLQLADLTEQVSRLTAAGGWAWRRRQPDPNRGR